jgi:hypothetical protein
LIRLYIFRFLVFSFIPSEVANTSRILGQLFGMLASAPSIASPQGVDIILILGQDSAASVDAIG